MKIEAGGFGSVIIDGVIYRKDVLILQEGVKENWWRKDGHSLVDEDLPQVFENPPNLFVMGCGYQGALKVPAKTSKRGRRNLGGSRRLKHPQQ